MMESVSQRLEPNGIYDLVDKCKLEQEFCLLLRDTTLLHIEHGSIIELADCRTMTTLHVVGINLEHRLSEHPCLASGTDILVAHLG